MSRRRTELPDSLELLLDTICNTFGAVIFISMLLSILAGEKASDTTNHPSDELIDRMVMQRQRDVAEARARHTRVKSQLDQQSGLLEKFGSPESLHMAMEISQASQSQLALLDSKAEQLETLTEQDAEALRKEDVLSKKMREREKLRQQDAALSRELEAATAQFGRKAKISRIRPTKKVGFVFMLHDKKLFRTMTASGEIDAMDCTEQDRAGSHVLVPRPTGGLVLPTQPNRIQDRFAHLDNRRHFVRLFVSPNSFAEFIQIKDALVDMNLEYEVIIFNDNKAELFLTSEPIDSFVQ